MNVSVFRDIIKERSRIAIETQDEWDYGIERCWNAEIAVLSENVEETIRFLDQDCTADEFFWISEIFDELVEATQSKALIECFYRVAKKYPAEAARYYIIDHIKMAEDFLNE